MLMYAAAGALVVLLLLLLVFNAQRKKKAGLAANPRASSASKSAPGKRSGQGGKTAKTPQPRRPSAPAPTARDRSRGAAAPASMPALPTEPLPPAGYTPPAPPLPPSVPAPRVRSVPMEDILPGTDPLRALIVELLSGWGDVTQEDTNRLTVFRADRVAAALSKAEIPKELKSSQHARARLAQLRRWASGMEQNAAAREQAALVSRQEYGNGATPQPGYPMPTAPALTSAPPMPSPVVPAMIAAPLAVMATPSLTPPAAAPAAPIFPAAPVPFFGQPVVEQPAPAPVAQPVAAPAPAPRSAPWGGDMVEASRSSEAAIAAAAAAFWARPELDGSLPESTPAATQTPPLSPPMPQVEPLAVSPLLQVPGQVPQSLPLGQDLPTLTVATPTVQPPSVAPLAQVAPHPQPMADAPNGFFEDLRGRVSTAEALLALPATEQPNLLAFLKPSELARVLQATTDPDLKKAVIDTLESVGSPSALDIIYRCLDDPDAQIQAKALAAADRLLGSEQ